MSPHTPACPLCIPTCKNSPIQKTTPFKKQPHSQNKNKTCKKYTQVSRARQQYGSATLATLGPTYAGASLPSTTLAARLSATQRRAAAPHRTGSLTGSLAAEEDSLDWLDTQERRGLVGGPPSGLGGSRGKREGRLSGPRGSLGVSLGGGVFMLASSRAADSMLLEMDEEGLDGWQVLYMCGLVWVFNYGNVYKCCCAMGMCGYPHKNTHTHI